MISKRRSSEMLLYLIKIFQLVGVGGIFTAAWYLYYSGELYLYPFYAKGDYVIIGLYLAMFTILSELYGGFNLTGRSSGEITFGLVVATIITNAFFYVVISLLMRAVAKLLPMAAITAIMIAFEWLWAKLAVRAYKQLVPALETVLIFDNAEAMADGDEIIRTMPGTFNLVNTLSMENGIDDVLRRLDAKRPEAVMLCGIGSSERNDIVKFCILHAIEAYVRPNIGDFIIKGSKQMQMNNLPVMLCQRSYPSAWYVVIKRLLDILLGLIAMVVFSPFMLVTAAAIKLYDGGPVFYKQKRLTKNRKEFYVYKFRSMRVDAEKDGVARLASQNDDRITPIGKIIRSLRIDEMPQLFCILKGDMTIVGPRPERPEIAAQYEQEIPEFALRLQAKAGLTGYAQVYGKYNTTPYNKLQMDLQYIGSMSLVTDFKIILATIQILFVPESTEGVAAGQVTASKTDKEK